ncbi:NAD(P)/FAD-dependent oxidoreductase [Paenarthrobacter nitroguajacolicus]|uniref:NAD(P)/FAD-dependent oxidoreductase n=1 Tax=Paenarthrobacter nitroguajacolicus TaxID=211146 RepID=UPI0015BD2846|nr:FAD/NAD(P)-binding oxidoreductase [Paenarthrobacter nitroguajacolicus]NWL11088.1 pyridine nucleotide-disulfide oxidoreductase [Paenarthrobacter nitroguajacolicus]NWL34329.1 pyridine nucleotide-disulfide oxidoreductase [Paenarthrobacter nitroguajacolicus]
MAPQHEVVIIGGGNAGVSLAARLKRYGVKDIALIEPKKHHLYQPLFSHIAGGRAQVKEAVRSQESVTPKGVAWIKDRAVNVDAGANSVTLASGSTASYGHLVVCPGLQYDWDAVPGLSEAVQSPYGSSHYEFELAPKLWTLLSTMKSGTVIFTMPSGPVKCGGASQKPMYLACDYWREQGVLENIRVVMVQPYPTVFGIPEVDRELDRKIAEYGIELRTNSELVAVNPAGRTATIRNNADHTSEDLPYDVLNAVPPQSAPDWLKTTDLPAVGDQYGFVEVDTQTLRHPRYPNVWSLGDAAGTTNSKAGGALRKQTKVLAKNLVSARKGEPLSQKYNGYSVCPFTVSRSTVVFAEFDPQYRPMPTIPKVPTWKENRLSWWVDRDMFPQVYWHLILKGRA